MKEPILGRLMAKTKGSRNNNPNFPKEKKEKTVKKPKETEKKETNPVGPPSKYDQVDIPRLKELCEIGCSMDQMAKFFNIDVRTLYNYRTDHPDLFHGIKTSRDLRNDQIVRSLFERAQGYSHEEDKIFCHQGQIVTARTIKHYPPDTAAAFIWLKNNLPAEWKDKKEVVGGLDREIQGPMMQMLNQFFINIGEKPIPIKPVESPKQELERQVTERIADVKEKEPEKEESLPLHDILKTQKPGSLQAVKDDEELTTDEIFGKSKEKIPEASDISLEVEE